MKKIVFFFITIICINLQSCADYVDDNAVPSGNNSSAGGSGNGSGGNNGGGNNGGGSMTISANLPVKIFSYLATTSIKYDNKDRISEISNLNENGKLGYYSNAYLTYSNDTLKNISYVSDYTGNPVTTIYNFSYSLNTISIEKLSEGSSRIEQVSIDNNERVTKVEEKDNVLSRSYSYDTKGNISMLKYSYSQLEVSFNYDNKTGIFEKVNLPQWLKQYICFTFINATMSFSMINNPVNSTRNQGSILKYSYFYQFNSNGYPEYVAHEEENHFNGYTYQIEYSK
ncbi:hypothetical protein [Paenimyroides baculatum]|uniref:YD repeat-containing protein n=1 Tax=Paenimyroides baculatum TaxID=2608000 RepID=A0A5M6CAA3_9FLAO|nr:hypothetical protein [Paenimyroides baculatum]KAA5531911.1 hypothetical protein F0460_14315 [Paenimyroides baculatum]